MFISGIQKFTMLDYPGKIACIVFTPGCNFRCGYCHNPEFVLPENIIKLKDSFIPEKAFFHFLSERRGLLDGVVVSGGEPTLAADLIPFIEKIRSLGFLVKLDTNGNRPDVLRKIIDAKLVDYVAMDVKADLEHYQSLVGRTASPSFIKQSIDILKACPIAYEFRSTIIKEIHNDTMLENIATLVNGARAWYLQNFRPAKTLDPTYNTNHGFSERELAALAQKFKHVASLVGVRT